MRVALDPAQLQPVSPHGMSPRKFELQIEANMKAYFIGGGIGSLAGAAFLVRDAQLPGRDIVIYEGAAAGRRQPRRRAARERASIRCAADACSRTDHYECLDLLSSISLARTSGPQRARGNRRRSTPRTRRIRRRGWSIATVSSSTSASWDSPGGPPRALRLREAPRRRSAPVRLPIGSRPIFRDQFLVHVADHFRVQPWHSAVEFKRYLHRFMNEFPRIRGSPE